MKQIQILLSISFLIYSSSLSAQIAEIPLEVNNVLVLEWDKNRGLKTSDQLKSGGPLVLPFYEDFNYDGPLPSSALWEDEVVYVNSAMGHNPPSIGVATFDGLNAMGQPYGGGFGSSDTLTSRPFNLSSFNSSDDIYLSFFIQAKGLGEKPELSDSLILEFKHSSGSWQNIDIFPGLSGVSPTFIPDFSQHFYPVTAQGYLHDSFQFRFRNYSSNTGFVDVWNIDYIQMDANRSPSDPSTNDIAFTSLPQPILNTYSAMPLDQFRADIPGELELGVAMNITNHFATGTSIDNRSVIGTEIRSSAIVLPEKNFGQQNFTPGQSLPFSDQLNLNTDFNFSALPGQLDLPNAFIETKYFFQTSNQDPQYFENDTVRTIAKFTNYFAYDDGSAETSIQAQGQGTQVVQKFHSNVKDTIQAVQFHFQRVQGSVANQQFNLKVWINDLDGTEDFDLNFLNPSYIDSINGFTTYLFDEPVYLESGDDFYVGWQQFTQTSNPIAIGFDKSNPDAALSSYFNDGTGWQLFPASFQGALMIRPIMGFDIFVNTIDPVVNPNSIIVFPNPFSNILKVEFERETGSDYQFEIHDIMGKLVLRGDLKSEIDVHKLAQGSYIITVMDMESGSRTSEKIIKLK